MIVSLHVTTGAAGGALAGSRAGAFVLGLALHGLGDAVPHHDIESQGFEIGERRHRAPRARGSLRAVPSGHDRRSRGLGPGHRARPAAPTTRRPQALPEPPRAGLAPRRRPPRLGPARRRRRDPGRAPRLAPPVRLVVLFALVALALGAFVLVTRGDSSSSAVVARVIDGDTIVLVERPARASRPDRHAGEARGVLRRRGLRAHAPAASCRARGCGSSRTRASTRSTATSASSPTSGRGTRT